MSDRTNRSDRLKSRFDDEPTDDQPDAEPGETSTDTDNDQNDEEWVRVQFRVPKPQRNLFNHTAYGNVIQTDPEKFGDIRKRDLQNAAVQVLIDNPDLWAEKAREMYDL
jgi:hypothetical protein